MAVAVLCGGCATTGTVAPVELDTPFDYDFRAPTNGQPPVVHAVVAGLTKVDPRFYDGWAGDCPGCDYDASAVAGLCDEQGYPCADLRDLQATQTNCVRMVFAAAKGFRPDSDILLLYISGHGGQEKDRDGDEEDGFDETLCLADGQMLDDVIRRLLALVPADVRVVFVTDTCNSGTNYRGPASMRAAIREARANNDKPIVCRVIHIGGCADGHSSEGGSLGGNLTLAWFAALKANPEQVWGNVKNEAQPLMWGAQLATYEEWNVDESFREVKVRR